MSPNRRPFTAHWLTNNQGCLLHLRSGTLTSLPDLVAQTWPTILPPKLSAGRARSAPAMSEQQLATSDPSPSQAIDFLSLVHNLKATKRTGWVKMGVAGPESIADHMYRMGLMALLVRDSKYDYSRCVKIALVHDVAEAIVGDLTPFCGVSVDDKRKLEADAMAQIHAMLGGSVPGSDIQELWQEYEAGQTPEANLVKDFDKLEMILQALEYETAQGQDLQEFFTSTDGKWRTELGRSWAAEITKRRAALHASKNGHAKV